MDKDLMDSTPIIEKLTQIGRESTVLSFDNTAVSPDCEDGVESAPKELLEEMQQYNLESYYVNHLSERSVFFKKLSEEEIMSYQTDLINSPLLLISDEIEDHAIHLFKLLQGYMEDKESVKKPIEIVQIYLKITLNSVEDLKDEAYIQVIKQINNHPDHDHMIRGWNFMAILASCYAPSTELYYALLNWLSSETKNPEKEIRQHANYVFKRLYKSFEQKRKQIPSDNEVIHIEHMKQIMFPIYFFSQTNTSIATESYTTVHDLKFSIMKKLQLSIAKIPYYCLYEVCDKSEALEERFLEDDDIVVDVIAIWDRESAYYKSKFKDTLSFKLYLTIELYYPYPDSDIETSTLEYVALNHDINMGKFRLEDQDIINLAALELFVDYTNDHEVSNKNFLNNMGKYIPSHFRTLFPDNYWEEKTMEKYTSLKFTTKMEAKLAYIDHMKHHDLYQAHQFYVVWSNKFNISNPDGFPEKLIIGIKPKGIVICDTDRNTLKELPYKVVASWGVNNEIFVIVVSKTQGEITKYYFETYQTQIFQYLIEAYTNIIVGKSVSSLTSSALHNIRRHNLINPKDDYSMRSRSSTSFKKKVRK